MNETCGNKLLKKKKKLNIDLFISAIIHVFLFSHICQNHVDC